MTANSASIRARHPLVTYTPGNPATTVKTDLSGSGHTVTAVVPPKTAPPLQLSRLSSTRTPASTFFGQGKLVHRKVAETLLRDYPEVTFTCVAQTRIALATCRVAFRGVMAGDPSCAGPGSYATGAGLEHLQCPVCPSCRDETTKRKKAPNRTLYAVRPTHQLTATGRMVPSGTTPFDWLAERNW